MPDNPLAGRWRRTDPPQAPRDPETVPFGHDPALLPDEVEFSGSRFNAARGRGQTFVAWDTGGFELADGQLHISLANDATGHYPIDVLPDRFTVTDAQGGETTYARLDAAPDP